MEESFTFCLHFASTRIPASDFASRSLVRICHLTRSSLLFSPSENFLPKIDGVTRTLARLLEHLHSEGHEAMVLGPDTGLVSRKLVSEVLLQFAHSHSIFGLFSDSIRRSPSGRNFRCPTHHLSRSEAQLHAPTFHSQTPAIQT